ncbi:hypothetical protein [Rhizobium chutanense]|uniref:hypothetical protein n=1 Tax=Rhizobium chutanense TaxID=2035448 RepID=UPI0013DE7E08|nr:hypothetical protein [Rhizobium chutanense]
MTKPAAFTLPSLSRKSQVMRRAALTSARHVEKLGAARFSLMTGRSATCFAGA